jgi:nitrogenase molybdenum-iron protein beta chain
MTGKFRMYPGGGVTVAELRAAGDSRATVALGPLASSAAAQALALKCHVPCEILELPIGLTATDKFIDTLRRVAGVSVPDSINRERGQLLDVMTDMHQYTYGKKVALAGDPDQLVALVDFLVTMDMQPIHIVSGTPGKKTLERMRPSLDKLGRPVNVKIPSDLYQLHQWIKQEPVDLMLRFGFPIVDRIGHQYFPTVGYKGGLRLLEKILGLVMDRQDRDAPEERFELVM